MQGVCRHIGAGVAADLDARCLHVAAPALGVAEILGASLVIVAVHRRTRAATGLACIARRAGIAVIARRRVGSRCAPTGGDARIICTRVAVVAHDRFAGCALTAGAKVIGGASAAIVAGQGVGYGLAAARRVAAVGRTQQPVVTQFCCACEATAGLARITLAAHVAVAAGRGVGGGGASGFRVAHVVGTGIAVVADFGGARQTSAVLARIRLRAKVAVAARHDIGFATATYSRITGIGGTRVVVVTTLGRSGHADAAPARVAHRAGVGVAASGSRVGGLAASHRIASVRCAWVCVGAHLGTAGEARTRLTDIALGTRIVVVARGGVCRCGHGAGARDAGGEVARRSRLGAIGGGEARRGHVDGDQVWQSVGWGHLGEGCVGAENLCACRILADVWGRACVGDVQGQFAKKAIAAGIDKGVLGWPGQPGVLAAAAGAERDQAGEPKDANLSWEGWHGHSGRPERKGRARASTEINR